MNTYFAIFLIATFTSLAVTPALRRACVRFDLIDVPADTRRVHKKAIPRLGGLAIYAAVIIALSTLPLVDNLLTQSIRAHKSEVFLTLIPATLVLILGIYDDLRGTNATVKFVSLGLIATLFYFLGGRIEFVTIPLVGSVHFPAAFSYIVTVLWLVGIANAFNLIDGIDGLASGAALFSSVVILVLSLASGNPLMTVVTLALCGALTGFLRYNFNPASIFLGDSGALFVGFTLAALSLLGAHKATTAVAVIIPLLAFGLPIVDTSVTMVRRLVSGRPLFQGDREHIHHMLLARGWSQRHVALVLYGVCATFGLLAAIFTKTSSPTTGFALFVLAVAVLVAVGQLRYHEMDEFKAGVKRNVTDRRIRVANNIRVRRASLAVSKASNLNDLLNSISQMLEFGEFVHAELCLGQAGNAQSNERALQLGPNAHVKGAAMRNGRIAWAWSKGDLDPESVIGSRHCWSVRLPLGSNGTNWGWINLYRDFASEPLLVDINYICDLFRRELSVAVERILRADQTIVNSHTLSMSVSAGKLTN